MAGVISDEEQVHLVVEIQLSQFNPPWQDEEQQEEEEHTETSPTANSHTQTYIFDCLLHSPSPLAHCRCLCMHVCIIFNIEIPCVCTDEPVCTAR